jgi:hypothetical protein
MNAIAPIPANDDHAALPANVEPDTWLNFLAHAVRDPSIQIDKLEALRRMQREDIAEQARLCFVQARRAAQSEMLPILRSEKNTSTNSKYAPLEAIDAVIRPIYTKHGFSMDFDSEPLEGGVRVICEVSHDAGHTLIRRLEGALDNAGPQGKANKTPIQALVSSTTYLHGLEPHDVHRRQRWQPHPAELPNGNRRTDHPASDRGTPGADAGDPHHGVRGPGEESARPRVDRGAAIGGVPCHPQRSALT